MGNAKRRGTRDERIAQAIGAGRVRKTSAEGVLGRGPGVPLIDLSAALGFLLSLGVKPKKKPQPKPTEDGAL